LRLPWCEPAGGVVVFAAGVDLFAFANVGPFVCVPEGPVVVAVVVTFGVPGLTWGLTVVTRGVTGVSLRLAGVTLGVVGVT